MFQESQNVIFKKVTFFLAHPLIRRDGATKLYISFVEGNHGMIVVSHVSFNNIEMI